MKMKFEKRSSDSSDDDFGNSIIPCTPAAKSTPLVSSSRVRKQSPSSEGSSKSALNKSAQIDSSSEGEEAPSNHGEPRRNSSSSDDEQDTVKVQKVSHNISKANRTVHAMSSSGSDDSDTDSKVGRNRSMGQTDSSDNSDGDDDTHQSTPAVAVITEQPRTSNSSGSESDGEATRQVAIVKRREDNSDSSNDDEELSSKPVSPQDSGDESSEDEEPATKPASLQQQRDSSDESSEDEEPATKPASLQQQRGSSDESSEDEKPATKPASLQQQRGSSDESSEDEEPATKPASLQQQRGSSDESSEDEEPATKPASLQQQRDSSDESSEDEEPATKPASLQKQRGSSDESSEDEEPATKPASLKHHRGSSDELSEDEEPATKPALFQQGENSSDESSEDEEPITKSASLQQRKDSSDDSSEDENHTSRPAFLPTKIKQERKDSSNESSDEEPFPDRVPSSFNIKNCRDSSDEEPSSQRVPSPIQRRRYQDSSDEGESAPSLPLASPHDHTKTSRDEKMPSSVRKKQNEASNKGGDTVLEQALKEKEPMHIGHPLLTVDEIGSDDEIWLFQCPKSMDMSLLKNKQLNLASDSNIQLKEGATFKRYTISPEVGRKNSVNCLLPCKGSSDFQISLLPVKGKVVIQEHDHVPKLKVPQGEAKLPIPLPCTVKVRHPLLGVGFQEHIAEAKSALRKNKKKRKREKSFESYHHGGTTNGYAQSSASDKIETNEKRRKCNSSLNSDVPARSDNEASVKKRKNYSSEVHERPSLNDSNGRGKESSKKKLKDKDFAGIQKSLDSSTRETSLDGSFLNVTYKKHKKSVHSEESPRKVINGTDNHLASWHTPQAKETLVSVRDSKVLSDKKSSKKQAKLLSAAEIKQEKEDMEMSSKKSSEKPNLETTNSRKRKKSKCVEENSLDNDQKPLKKKKLN